MKIVSFVDTDHNRIDIFPDKKKHILIQVTNPENEIDGQETINQFYLDKEDLSQLIDVLNDYNLDVFFE